MALVDTSVWIDVYNETRFPADVSPDEIVTCLPIVQEVLQRFRDERDFDRIARVSSLDQHAVR